MLLGAALLGGEPSELLHALHFLLAGIGVAGLVFGRDVVVDIVEVLSIILLEFAHLTIGREEGHALMRLGGVDGIVVPRRCIIVDVPHHEAVTVVVPAEGLLLTVLEDVVLVAAACIFNNVCHALLVDGWHVGYLGGLRQRNEVDPSGQPTLVGCIGRRHLSYLTRTVVGAAVHHVPVLTSCAAIVLRVVEIGVAQAMAELVASCADAVEHTFGCKFVGDGIRVDIDAVQALSATAAAIVLTSGKVPLVGPNVAGLAILCHTSIDDVDLVHLAIVVPVVIGIVDVGIGKFQGLDDHFGGTVVELIVGSRSVVVVLLGKSEGAHYVEVDVEQAVALFKEIVADGADVAVEGIALLVEAALPLRGGTGLHVHVGELDEQDQSALRLGLRLGTEGS